MAVTMQDRKENFRPPQEIHVIRPLSPLSAFGDEYDEHEFDGDDLMAFSSTDDHLCDRYGVILPNLNPLLYEKSKKDNGIGGDKEIDLSGFKIALLPPPPPPPNKDSRLSSQHSSHRVPRRTQAEDDLRFSSQHSSPRRTQAPPPRYSSPRESKDAGIILKDSDAFQVTRRGSLMRQKCVRDLNSFSSDRNGMSSQHSMKSENQFVRAASCRDVFSSSRPRRAPPSRGALPRRSKNESALLKCLARAASEHSLNVKPAEALPPRRPMLSRQYQSARHLGRTQSRLHATKDNTADAAKLSLSSHFPSVAMCMQSGHGDSDVSPRRPICSRQYQSARHLVRTQSLDMCMQSGHGNTDKDLPPRRPMLSRQYQSARHLDCTHSRLHVTKNNTADTAKLSLSSHFPSVAMCIQSGHGDSDEDLSPEVPMRKKSIIGSNSSDYSHSSDEESTVLSFAGCAH
jgi:hypothetical protein